MKEEKHQIVVPLGIKASFIMVTMPLLMKYPWDSLDASCTFSVLMICNAISTKGSVKIFDIVSFQGNIISHNCWRINEFKSTLTFSPIRTFLSMMAFLTWEPLPIPIGKLPFAANRILSASVCIKDELKWKHNMKYWKCYFWLWTYRAPIINNVSFTS